MTLPEPNTKWVAGLSNGETIVEGVGVAEKKKGELSPFLKLQEYIKEKSLTIQSLNIWVGGKHFNIPSANYRFDSEVPIRHNFFRRFASDAGGENVQHFACVEAIYPEYKLQLWVDENDTNKVWIAIRNGRF